MQFPMKPNESHFRLYAGDGMGGAFPGLDCLRAEALSIHALIRRRGCLTNENWTQAYPQKNQLTAIN